MRQIRAIRPQLMLALVLIMIGVGFRLIHHIPNVTPITAVALVSGSVLSRKLAPWVPVTAMIISDAIIGFYGFTMFITWGCFALISLFSTIAFRKPSLFRGVLVIIGSSVFFYIVTNFAVWLFGTMYAHDLSGLVLCYQMALPFFRNMAVGDLIFSGVLFGGYATYCRFTLQPRRTILSRLHSSAAQ